VIVVVRPGPLTTIQDLGRPGLGALGVGPSGAADRSSLIAANRLVGNPDGAAGLEVTLGGLAVSFTSAALVSVGGAECPVRLDGVAVTGEAAIRCPAGSRLELGTARDGLRGYLAVRGGIDVEPVLGSRSTDTLAGLGPPKLRAGDRLPVGSGLVRDVVAMPQQAHSAAEAPLRVLAGPRLDWFAAGALELLCSTAWTVMPASDRVGLRLGGPPLERTVTRELPSEPMVRGAVQVPPDGQPVLLLADYPVTGGYPVIAVVADADTDRAAQLRPGRPVRFVARS
jgi:biotin-dependent carboxylase-like uncharacterized protein